MPELHNSGFPLQRHHSVGRSFNEYLDIFNLSEEDMTRDIVGVGDGPASFNARMYQRGTPIISVDPIYRYSEVELRQRIQETYDDVIAQAVRIRINSSGQK